MISPLIVEFYPHVYSVTVKIPASTHVYSASSMYSGSNFNIYARAISEYKFFDQYWQDCITSIGIGMSISTNFYLENDFYFEISPLKPNTEYEIWTNDTPPISGGGTNAYLLGTVTTLPANTQYNAIYDEYGVDIPTSVQARFKYEGHTGLTFDEKIENSEIIRSYLTNVGWSESAIAAVLGAMYCLGDMNPAYQIPFIKFDNRIPLNAAIRYNRLLTSYNGLLTSDISSPTFWNNNIDNIQPYHTWGVQEYNLGIQTAYRQPIYRIGLLGIKSTNLSNDFNINYLYHFDPNVFPKGEWLNGEYQLQYLVYEAMANLNWKPNMLGDYMEYADFIHFNGDPQRAAEIFATHHNYLLTSGNPTSYDDEARRAYECIKQWAQYFYKPTRKKHKMPLWEYLRYTV